MTRRHEPGAREQDATTPIRAAGAASRRAGEPPGDSLVGVRLGPFSITAFLGRGGMGAVYRGRDERLHRDVAIKVLGAAEVSEDSRGLLLREARLASAMNHPNVCTIYDVGDHEGLVYLAMELVEGRPLSECVPPGGMAPEQVIHYGRQIAEALDHAHQRGVVHRDLKTANVVVTPEGRVKVLDFGLARRVEAPNAPAEHTVSETGVVVGTPHYIAPEVLLGMRADERSDLWSLGVVLHEMASGELPFRGVSMPALCDAILHASPAPLPDRVPPGLRAVMLRLLEKAPERRYGRASEALAALEALHSDRGLRVPSGTHVARPSASRPGRLRVAAIAGAAAVAIAVAAFLILRGTAGADDIRSLAVLPLANRSGDASQDFFADGMTDELITELAPLPGLKVISRTTMMRYKGTTKTIPEIASELDVDGVVEGAVLRSGDRVRISAQLVHARSDRPVWAESYERDLQDVLALQSEVARDIVEKIRLELSSEDRGRMARSGSVQPRAYESYLRGMQDLHTLSDPLVRRAAKRFEEAIALDPNDARSYAGLAKAHLLLCQVTGSMSFAEALPRVREHAERALEIDPRSAEAHAARGVACLWVEHDWRRAEEHLRRAVRLNPNDADVRVSLGILFTALGRHEEGLRESERAIELDPLSMLHRHTYTWQLVHLKRYDDAQRQIDHQLAMDSTFAHAWGMRARIHELRGRYREAAAMPGRGTRSGRRPGLSAALLAAYEREGARGYWQVMRDSTVAPPEHDTLHSYWWCAYVYANLGDREAAFEQLRAGVERGEGDMVFLKVDNFLAPLHSDPRYAELVRRMGLPS